MLRTLQKTHMSISLLFMVVTSTKVLKSCKRESVIERHSPSTDWASWSCISVSLWHLSRTIWAREWTNLRAFLTNHCPFSLLWVYVARGRTKSVWQQLKIDVSVCSLCVHICVCGLNADIHDTHTHQLSHLNTLIKPPLLPWRRHVGCWSHWLSFGFRPCVSSTGHFTELSGTGRDKPPCSGWGAEASSSDRINQLSLWLLSLPPPPSHSPPISLAEGSDEHNRPSSTRMLSVFNHTCTPALANSGADKTVPLIDYHATTCLGRWCDIQPLSTEERKQREAQEDMTDCRRGRTSGKKKKKKRRQSGENRSKCQGHEGCWVRAPPCGPRGPPRGSAEQRRRRHAIDFSHSQQNDFVMLNLPRWSGAPSDFFFFFLQYKYFSKGMPLWCRLISMN